MMEKEFTVIIEQDEDGFYVAEVPALRGCYTQGKTIKEAMERIKEVIAMCLEEQKDLPKLKFIDVKQVSV
jgi:predicted RNase H-like HicB family nuclease